MDHSPINIRRAKLSPGMLERQLFMVKSQQMQHRRMQIMHMNTPLDGMVTNFVSTAPRHSGADTTAGKKHREPSWVVIPTIIALRKWGATEFPAPPDQSVLQQAALLQITN